MSPPQEQTPLLDDDTLADLEQQHSLLYTLDAEHNPDHVHDLPPTPRVNKVKQQLMTAATQPGHSHPVHEQMHSPALLLRLRQSVDHGFRNIASACRHAFTKPKSSTTPSHSSNTTATAVPTAPSTPSIATPPAETAEHARQNTVRAVFVIAVFTMIAMTSVSPTLLLYMNDSGFTSATNIAPYVITAALSTAVPVFSNIALTSLASHIGPGRALSIGAAIAAFGIIMFTLSRDSLVLFMIGYALYASCNSFRVVRVALLTKVVPPKDRTTVLATHALMTPTGALIGPMVWISAQAYRGSLSVPLGGPFEFVVDRFSIDYLITLLAMLGIYFIAAARLRNIIPFSAESTTEPNDGEERTGHPNDASGADATGHQLHPVVIRFADGNEVTVNLEKYRNRVFTFFCAIMLGVNLSAGIYMTAFQPVLVNVFNTSDAKLGGIYEAIAIFAIIPPLLVAVLSRRLMDRQILVIGLSLKLIGMMLFLPIFGPVRESQVIIGFLLVIKASIFFSTASMSLFTKILGPMSTSSLLGLLASASSIGPAITQILLASRIVEWFGSFWFGLFALPTVGSLVTIILPRQWRRMNPNCEFISLVTHEAELQQAEA